MSPQLYSYLLAHTREPEVLQQLRLETAGMQGGHMQVGEDSELLWHFCAAVCCWGSDCSG
jgi:hypothetical protein